MHSDQGSEKASLCKAEAEYPGDDEEPSDAQIVKAIENIIKGGNLEILTKKKVLQQLEKEFECELAHRKASIYKEVTRIVNEQQSSGEEDDGPPVKRPRLRKPPNAHVPQLPPPPPTSPPSVFGSSGYEHKHQRACIPPPPALPPLLGDLAAPGPCDCKYWNASGEHICQMNNNTKFKKRFPVTSKAYGIPGWEKRACCPLGSANVWWSKIAYGLVRVRYTLPTDEENGIYILKRCQHPIAQSLKLRGGYFDWHKKRSVAEIVAELDLLELNISDTSGMDLAYILKHSKTPKIVARIKDIHEITKLTAVLEASNVFVEDIELCWANQWPDIHRRLNGVLERNRGWRRAYAYTDMDSFKLVCCFEIDKICKHNELGCIPAVIIEMVVAYSI